MNEQVYWSPGVTLELVEKQVILNAFRFYRGNKTQCAISLGIAIRTLENKLEKYEQDGVRQREQEELDARRRAEILDRQRGIIPGTKSEAGGPRVYGSASGVHVESAPSVPAQQPLPVPQRSEVQSVLPKNATASGVSPRRR